MKQQDVDKLVLYWVKASEIDITAAREIFEKTGNYVTVLFHLHLAIEKVLKAYYVQIKKEHAPYSHNLIFLSKLSELELSDKNKKLFSEINEFNIECRYPDEKFSIYKKADKKFTEKYLLKSEEIFGWISGILNREQ